jgi:hypothetical protein
MRPIENCLVATTAAPRRGGEGQASRILATRSSAEADQRLAAVEE